MSKHTPTQFGQLLVVRFSNGLYGVKDLSIKGFQTIASGMTFGQAAEYASRMSLRKAWGI